jgi:L-lactate dehydrogenase complex protein LldG
MTHNNSKARESILQRVRQNLEVARRLPEAAQVSTPPATRLDPHNNEELIRSFAAELTTLTGIFHRCPESQVAHCILDILQQAGAGRLLAWSDERLPVAGLLETLRGGGIRVQAPAVPLDGPERTARLAEIEQAGFGLTGGEAALADIGGVVVRSGAGQARLASLLPPTHIALVRSNQFYPSLYDWMAKLEAEGRLAEMIAGVSNVTVITGPSRTADIEKMLVLGVHGPKTLHVICVEKQPEDHE